MEYTQRLSTNLRTAAVHHHRKANIFAGNMSRLNGSHRQSAGIFREAFALADAFRIVAHNGHRTAGEHPQPLRDSLFHRFIKSRGDGALFSYLKEEVRNAGVVTKGEYL